ncbi:hypothetical protein [uncultured Lacinutrix sp.]|uniref:hypothetical protein n=1 Tax=uncultured Lacinutrix sp. TaxID=574032 RepID=UPI00260A4C61|nr:hypothetical protein [uncultured Lacinutrix sp.]
MEQIIKYITVLILFFVSNYNYANTTNDINVIINELTIETKTIVDLYTKANLSLYKELNIVKKELSKPLKTEDLVSFLIKKDEIEERIKDNMLSQASDVSKVRYLKGLEIIRILYEKVLSLDHHFASVATFNEINNLSNPNHYPEFLKMKDIINDKKDRKKGFNLSGILGDNIYTSVLYSFVSLFNNENASKKEKEMNLKEVECILDFTLRMHNELNTIYFETAFLRKSNDNIMIELEQLFVDFTKPIQYKVALKECRNSDDWDAVRQNLSNYLKELDKIINDNSQRFKAHKMQVNLAFPIDRLVQYIAQYNSHIDQGAKFYEKFGIMLDSYENEQQCSSKIPIEYNKLKTNIKTSIEKFNTAYKPVEINGSKMKQVLYGMNEYD